MQIEPESSPYKYPCDVEGCTSGGATERGLKMHKTKAHGNGKPLKVNRQMEVMWVIQALFPKGIQTADPVQLDQDLSLIEEIRRRT